MIRRSELGESMGLISSVLRPVSALLLAAALAACSSVSHPERAHLDRATVLVEHAKGHGTGTIVGPHSVLTAYHVVQDNPLDVRFFQGQIESGSVVWADRELDLALIDVPVPPSYQAARIACEDPTAGQYLVSIGHPINARWVAVGGYLPGTERIGKRFVSLGFPIGLGTSGGPIFDEQGRVVGVAQAILIDLAAADARFDDANDTGIGLMLPAKHFCDRVVRR